MPKFKVGDIIWAAIFIRGKLGHRAEIIEIKHHKTWKKNYFDEVIIYRILILDLNLADPEIDNIKETRILSSEQEAKNFDVFSDIKN